MTYLVSVTSQGQISIPAPLRRKFGMDKNGQVLISEEENKLTLEPTVDFLQLKGSLKSNKIPLTNKQLHEIVAEAFAEEYAKNLK